MTFIRSVSVTPYNRRSTYYATVSYGMWHVSKNVSSNFAEANCGKVLTNPFEVLETTRTLSKFCSVCEKDA